MNCEVLVCLLGTEERSALTGRVRVEGPAPRNPQGTDGEGQRCARICENLLVYQHKPPWGLDSHLHTCDARMI